VFGLSSSPQVASDQTHQSYIGDGSPQQIHQHVVIDRVEELCQVDVLRDASAVLHSCLHLPNLPHLPEGLMCITARAEAELKSENVGSKIGVSTWAMACWTKRSVTAGSLATHPSRRLPPSGLKSSMIRDAVPHHES